MKNKEGYKKELKYQLELMRTLDSQTPERELALSLLEYARLTASGEMSRADRGDWISALTALAAEIEDDPERLESFRWIYIVNLVREQDRQAVAEVVQELCSSQFEFLDDYLGATLPEIEDKLKEIRHLISVRKLEQRTS